MNKTKEIHTYLKKLQKYIVSTSPLTVRNDNSLEFYIIMTKVSEGVKNGTIKDVKHCLTNPTELL